MTALETRRYYERAWRWAMSTYWAIWLSCLVVSCIRDPYGHASSWLLLAGFPPFVSMALFGLYTGEISVQIRTIYRREKPALFWVYFATNLFVAAVFLVLGLLS